MALAFGSFLTLSYPIIIWVTMGNACKPVSHFWTQFSGTDGKCINVNRFFLTLGILNMLNDLIILIIPFPRIAQLQMTLRKESAICGIMAVGILYVSFVCLFRPQSMTRAEIFILVFLLLVSCEFIISLNL